MLNQVIRCSFQHSDCNNVSVLHEYMTEPASHDKLQILLTDSFDLLEDLSKTCGQVHKWDDLANFRSFAAKYLHTNSVVLFLK